MDNITKDINSAIESSAKKVADTFAGAALHIARGGYRKLKIHLRRGFERISKYQYERCSRIKIIINRQEPVELRKIYVRTKFSVGANQHSISDSKLIKNACAGHRKFA